MAAATIAFRSTTPNSLVLSAVFDTSGTGATIPIATILAACQAGGLKRLLAGVTDASCEQLNPSTNPVGKDKKLRVYVLGTIESLTTINGSDPSYAVRFVTGSGLVIPQLHLTGSYATIQIELRFLHSSIR